MFADGISQLLQGLRVKSLARLHGIGHDEVNGDLTQPGATDLGCRNEGPQALPQPPSLLSHASPPPTARGKK
jgi:hypothetical protein